MSAPGSSSRAVRGPSAPALVPAVLAVCAGLVASAGAQDPSPPAPSSPKPPAGPPPVVVWMVDTLRADHLSAYGYERATSPRLDAFAAGGVLFEQAHAHSNWTQPSVASLLTGRHPMGLHGDFGDALPDELLLAAEWFAAHGYRTAGFTVSVAVAATFGFDQGFEVYAELDADFSPHERTRRDGAAFDAQRVVERALRWLDDERDDQRDDERPFFLYLHSVDPHLPHEPHADTPSWGDPGAYDGPLDGSVDGLHLALKRPWMLSDADRQHIIDLYDGELAYSDAWFGRLLDGLVARGLGHALVLFVSDHGEELWDRTTYGHGHENLHAELTHVPLVLGRADGGAGLASERDVRDSAEHPGSAAAANPVDRVPRGARLDGLVGLVDVLPTLLDLVGLPAIPGFDGRSLAADVLAGASRAERQAPRRHFMDRARKPVDLRGVRTPRMLFLADPVRKRQRLYDLFSDPEARRNLAASRPGAARELSTALGRWQRVLRERAARLTTRKLELDAETLERLRALGYVR